MLAYLFVCFSIGLLCFGAFCGIMHRHDASMVRAFVGFYFFLTVSLLSGLVLTFLGVLPNPPAPTARVSIEYLESMVGFYGMLFAVPYFAHCVFAVKEKWRDQALIGIVGFAFVAQHATEYGFGGRWDAAGDFGENVLFLAAVGYAFLLGMTRLNLPEVERSLAQPFLVLVAIGFPLSVHDLFWTDSTGLRFCPLLCCAWGLITTWTICRQVKNPQGTIPNEWQLTERESEVLSYVLQGLSNKEIASAMFISTNTVKTHLRAVFDKSGCRSRVALMAFLGSCKAAP